MFDLKAFLRQVPLFKDVPQRAIDIAAEAMQLRSFEAGSTLFREGDTGEALYILVSGLVKVSKVDLDGHEKTLAIFQSSEVLGEMALLSEDQRSATALALSKVEALVLYRDDFLKLLTNYPIINLNLTSTLAQRLRGMSDEAQVLSYKDAQGRVAYVLLRLYRGGVLEFNKGGQAVVRLTHQELASLAGTSRETVTRALKVLEDEGVIQTRPKEVLISDPDGLEEILHGIR
ncbi:MAG: Crp/Fnr family transcriptional regulator [Truepera sp.]|nr:Crp/Fnr family transcriptional regulator [Truepera sp.]